MDRGVPFTNADDLLKFAKINEGVAMASLLEKPMDVALIAKIIIRILTS